MANSTYQDIAFHSNLTKIILLYLMLSEKASTPNFDTLYGPLNGMASLPTMLETLTTRPLVLFRSGRNVVVTSIGPKRLMLQHSLKF